MAVYNTALDSANTAVRAFLTKVGEYYLGYLFNTRSGEAKIFGFIFAIMILIACCAYCGEKHEKLQVEHVLMFNRT